MRRPVYRTFLVLALSAAALSTARAFPRQTIRLAPRDSSTPDSSTIAVIVGLKPNATQGTAPGSSFEATRAGDTAKAEAQQRSRRVAAERAVAASVSTTDFTPTRYFQSFPLVAGRATPEGALALASRPDVAWVIFDGVKRLNTTSPALQPMQLLVRSPRANGLGFTGQGQAVAVLDTGVDYTVAELGGAAFPNAKVVGGTNIADGTSDPLDCAGHGTSVAAIIAGTAGIAPDAKIVAIKVFPGCEEFAFDSDILAGIDFAIVNSSQFSITAINMSLGADLSGGSDLGYCDSLEPDYAAAFDAARSAGIAVVVASGNDAESNALSSPACVSSAISVGAVYSQQIDGVNWGECEDNQVQPDTPTCFSNSNSNLSLLAPGAFWNVVTFCGVLQSFSGTSAAAPTVAGAVAVLKQARPTLSPAGLASLLSASGKPVRTPSTGLLTPRIDVFAATQMASSNLVTWAGDPIPIPDGVGSATATLTVSGFTSPLGSVQALVSIDHPDPTQLQLTLAGPDGTTVLLQDHTGEPQHLINTVFGLTGASANALTAFEGKTANGVWTLTVSDTVPGQTGRITAFSLALVPGQPHVALTSVDGFVIPSVSRSDADQLSSADLRLYNPGSAPKTFQIFFVPKGQTGALAMQSTRTVGAGQVLALNDVLFSEFGYTQASGQITIGSDDANFFASSRSYTDSLAGSTGALLPGQPTAGGLSAGTGVGALTALTRQTFAHSDVGFVEVSGAMAIVRFRVFDASGAFLGSTQQTALPNQSVLLADPIRYFGLPLTPSYRVDATVVSASGAVVPFATTTDDLSGDFVFEGTLPYRPSVTSPADWIVPEVVSAASGSGALQTDLSITNLDTAPATVTVSLVPRSLSGTPAGPRTYTIGAGQTLTKADVLLSEFALSQPSSAALRVHPAAPAILSVSARRTLALPAGGYASAAPAVAASAALAAGGGSATAIQMDQNAATRSSFGLVEVSGSDASVHVSVVSGDSGSELGAKDYTVPAGTAIFVGAEDILGSASASNIYFRFSVPSGAGQVVAYGLATDVASGDAIQVAARPDP